MGSLGGAKANLAFATRAALALKEQEEQSSNYHVQQANVVAPMATLSSFTTYNPLLLQRPIVYEDKPAYGAGKRDIDFIIPAIIAITIFQGAVMGMGRSVAGEKREGSLTRVFLTPTSNATIILGTLLFYVLFEIFRSSFLILIAVSLFHIKIEGSLLALFVIVSIYAAVSTGIGMFLSSLVSSEQQYMGVSMLVSMPTIFLAGAFFPVQAMPKALQAIAVVLPVTYAAEALRGIMIKGFSLATVSVPTIVLCLFLALSLGGCFMVFKREIDR